MGGLGTFFGSNPHRVSPSRLWQYIPGQLEPKSTPEPAGQMGRDGQRADGQISRGFACVKLFRRCVVLCAFFFLGIDSPFFSTFFSTPRCFPWVFDGFLTERIPGKNGEGTLDFGVATFSGGIKGNQIAHTCSIPSRAFSHGFRKEVNTPNLVGMPFVCRTDPHVQWQSKVHMVHRSNWQCSPWILTLHTDLS